MREDLLGLTLEAAQEVLSREGIIPQTVITSAPRRAQEAGGVLRVVHASDDGRRLTAAQFLNPLENVGQENS